jgi:hypothetical protein
MQRTILGLISVACFVAAAVLFARETGVDDSFARSIAIRIGLITFAWWLAYPDFAKMPKWMMVVFAVLVLVVAVRPKLIPLAILALIAYAVLRPRVKRLAEAVANEQRNQ